MFHLHLTAIVITIILFLVTYFSYKKDPSRDNRRAFILYMTLRLFYIIVLFSSVIIFIQNLIIICNIYKVHMMYGIKPLLCLLTIELMEMTLVREKNQTKVHTFLIIAIVL